MILEIKGGRGRGVPCNQVVNTQRPSLGDGYTRPNFILRSKSTASQISPGDQSKAASSCPSEPQQVRNLHEELPAVIHEIVPRRQQAGWCRYEAPVQVLEVAVVPNVDRSAGMQQISDQEVGIEVLGGRQ